MGYKTFGCNTESLPSGIVEIFTKAYDVPDYVETGTAGGLSVAVASQLFKRCYTVELIDGRVIEKSLDNVEYFTGNSVDILPKIIYKFEGQYVFFFLDAHYSDSVPNTSEFKECPVIDELQSISVYQKSIILIDDARLFFGHPPYPNDPRSWPTIEQIFETTKKLFPNHHTTITDDFVLVYPDEMSDAVSAEWRKRFSIRYPSAEDRLKSETKSVWESFKKYVDEK